METELYLTKQRQSILSALFLFKTCRTIVNLSFCVPLYWLAPACFLPADCRPDGADRAQF